MGTPTGITRASLRGFAFCVGVLAGPAAQAGPLASAELWLELGELGTAAFSGAGAMGSSTGDLAASLDAGTAFSGSSTTLVTLPAPLSQLAVEITANSAVAFTGATPGSVGGAGRIGGVVALYGVGAKLLEVPLALGVPETITKSAGGITFTVIHAAWTVGTAMVTGPTGVQGGTVMETRTGANALTPGGAGELLLVTPVRLTTNLVGTIPSFGFLRLTYVPEPGTLGLLGLGMAGLAALGRRRR